MITGYNSVVNMLYTHSKQSLYMIDLFEKILLLKNSDIFNQINTDDLRYVADALDEEKYLSGDIVFEQDDRGDNMYVIVDGQVGISIDRDTDSYVAIMSAGECFGEMNLLDGLPRSASAIIISDATVLKLSQPKLRGLLVSYPELGLGMLKAMSLKLRSTTQMVKNNEKANNSK